jgi:hypothetical protein
VASAAGKVGQGAGQATGNLGQVVGGVGRTLGQAGHGAGQALGGLTQGVGQAGQGATQALGGGVGGQPNGLGRPNGRGPDGARPGAVAKDLAKIVAREMAGVVYRDFSVRWLLALRLEDDPEQPGPESPQP